MNESDFLTPAPDQFVWPRCPEADRFVRRKIADFLQTHDFARTLAHRMKKETSTELAAWTDHLVLSEQNLNVLGYVREDGVPASAGLTPYWHPFADLPRIVLSSDGTGPALAVTVDSISDFLLAHGISVPIEGAPYSAYRRARIRGEKGNLLIVERHGPRTYRPDENDDAAEFLGALEAWTNRPRVFASTEEGLSKTNLLGARIAGELGTAAAASVFLEGERRYWQKRNRAGRVQKARQDRLGLGWANHDHHTFRSSRRSFPALIDILKTFGFKKRERFYAGAEAGWGAQVMEQPEAKLIIFADVDLTPADAAVDFTVQPLADLKKPGTVGLWCALHGESILQAGMHHLEAKFDFNHLIASLKEDHIGVMPPFTDFPHLRQAFTEGELWRVPLDRLNRLKKDGMISAQAFQKIKKTGAVGSHLENLQRRDGFKGFNQRGVSDIILAVNPEKQALKKIKGKAA